MKLTELPKHKKEPEIGAGLFAFGFFQVRFMGHHFYYNVFYISISNTYSNKWNICSKFPIDETEQMFYTYHHDSYRVINQTVPPNLS